tara:strand:- start:313 stop:546 length:234 start_codon:yes stop_codon:yes gene_type:complete
MKLRTKDEIITCLIDILSKDALKYHPMDDGWKVEKEAHDEILFKGWVECLKWVLGLTEEEKKVFVEGKNTLVVKNKE